MGRALSLSFLLHFILIAALLWSGRLSLLFFQAREREFRSLGAIQIDLTYKMTDTAMKLGKNEKDLPAPIVHQKPPAEAPKILKEMKKIKPIAKPKTQTKENVKSILDKLKAESSKEDDRPKPKQNNFPKSEKGEKGATGTGGRSMRPPSPAEQALQSAMRRYFELTDAGGFRRKNPDVRGYLAVKLLGDGNQFQIAALQTIKSSGFTMLDRSCEIAIRKAVDSESFAKDIIAELQGKETLITCEP
ncbi:MAG: hypothetical protein J0L93_04185 [Deltaproteobacteria bacterium]|nr:hypothetical protein [Deltaproteobacteria bacterium]